MLQREPQHVEAREMLSSTYMNRAETFVRQGRRSEAVHDWKRMVDLGEGQKRAELRVNRAMALAQLGDHARATAEVEDMLKGGSVPFYSHYNFVCVFSLSVRAVRDDAALFQAQRDELAKKYGAEAVKLLGRMKADRFFGSSGVVEYMKNDTDLDPLLERADYKKLLQELEREAAARK